jgi:hypothetical protein
MQMFTAASILIACKTCCCVWASSDVSLCMESMFKAVSLLTMENYFTATGYFGMIFAYRLLWHFLASFM